jgi:DnaJ-domain-containing protein 1
MTTTYTVQELAQQYAEALVEYHSALYSDVCDRDRWVREAKDAMYDAQHDLDEACKCQAQMNHA